MDPVGADGVSRRHARLKQNPSKYLDGPRRMDSLVSMLFSTRNPDGADRVPNLNAISLKFFQIYFCVSYISLISCYKL
jgi:hypothetical protein